MFWFDNSRKNLASFARNLSSEERGSVEEFFSELISREYGIKAPTLRFNSSDAKVY